MWWSRNEDWIAVALIAAAVVGGAALGLCSAVATVDEAERRAAVREADGAAP